MKAFLYASLFSFISTMFLDKETHLRSLAAFTQVLGVPSSCSFEVVGFRLHVIITFFVCIYILTGKNLIDPFSIIRLHLKL
jgi:hypothetical protein